MRSCTSSRRRTCSWFRSIVGAGGTATTRCSVSSCSASCAAVEPDLVEKLNLKAADWYEANGSPALAVEHLLDTTERDRCIQLVTALALPTYKAGHISTVYRWLTALGDDAIDSYPPLAVLAGWITSLSGDIVPAQRLAAIVDAASYELVPLDGSASFDSARAMWRAFMCPAGPESMLLDADLALEQEPPWSPWRDNALVIAGEAYLLSGDVDRAAALFTESSALGGGELQHRFARAQRERARVAGDGSRPMGRRGRPSGASADDDRGASTATTTPRACLHSSARLDSPCIAVTGRRRSASSRGPCAHACH